jgi:imidazolonepropionase-like amidohydrolase
VAGQDGESLLVRNARVFDGERVLERTDVLVQDGLIRRMGTKLDAPGDATVVDATGHTLLPGLIDAHTHAFGDALRDAIMFGVTTELDMFTDHRIARQLRAQQIEGGATDRADLFSAGTLVTAPDGHGTEYGITIPTIRLPDSAQAFVNARIAEGSDWIKIVYDDGSSYGVSFNTLDRATLQAVVEAAHRRDKLAVVHPGTYQDAMDAIEVGADGLVHVFLDRAPDAEFGSLAAQNDVFVIPTLVVMASVAGEGQGAQLADDSNAAPWLTTGARAGLRQTFPGRAGTSTLSYAAAERAVQLLRDAGVPILAGTDAPNPGTAHGASMHQELTRLVEAGLTPLEALAAATSAPATAFDLSDRGRIEVGRRADLLLVEGDPTSDIRSTMQIRGVWKLGQRIDRAAYAETVAAAREQDSQPPEGMGDGLISDFEDGEPSARFGTVWSASSDAMAGGSSTGEMTVVDGGSDSGKVLHVEGTISDAVPYAWYGAMWSPGDRPMSAVNLLSAGGLSFKARGDGGTYRAMVFAQGQGQVPLVQTFVAESEWQEIGFRGARLASTVRVLWRFCLSAGHRLESFVSRSMMSGSDSVNSLRGLGCGDFGNPSSAKNDVDTVHDLREILRR